MATEVTLPEMGAEIEDATINRWLVSEGQEVAAGDPLLEIATAKVDTEIPAPVGGTVLSIRFGAGEIVELTSILAVIGEPGEAVPDSGESFQGGDGLEGDAEEGGTDEPGIGTKGELSPTQKGGIKATPVARRMAEEAGVSLTALEELGESHITKSDIETYLLSRQVQVRKTDRGPEGLPEEEPVGAEERAPTGPVTAYDYVAPLEVRRLAAAYDLDLNEVAGDRPLSALSRHDLLRYAEEQGGIPGLSASADYPRSGRLTVPRDGERKRKESDTGSLADAGPERIGEQLVPHSRMRLAIARNTVASAFTAPHVTTVHSVNMSAVTGHYQAYKGEFAREGARLTLTAYLVKAVVAALKAVPAGNAEWTEEGLLIKFIYNIGMAVALPADDTGTGGLVVPVIRDAGGLNLLGIARQVADLSERGREGRLNASDLQEGTFTLTNYGTSGSLFQTPVILQPQVAILGTGAIEKRPVVISRGKPYEARLDDHLAFHPMMDIALSYDHRVLDGASADALCTTFKQVLEHWEEAR